MGQSFRRPKSCVVLKILLLFSEVVPSSTSPANLLDKAYAGVQYLNTWLHALPSSLLCYVSIPKSRMVNPVIDIFKIVVVAGQTSEMLF